MIILERLGVEAIFCFLFSKNAYILKILSFTWSTLRHDAISYFAKC